MYSFQSMMDEENIIAKAPSELIHPLRQTLPPIDAASNEPCERTIDLPEFGRLIVTFKKFNHRHHKSGYSFWVVQRVFKAKD